MKIKFFILLAFSYCFGLKAQSTGVIYDGGLRSGLRLTAEWNRNWKSYVHGEYRWNENLSRSDKWYLETGSSYEPLQGLKLSMAYRFENRYRIQEKSYFPVHRIEAGPEISRRFGRFKPELRSLIQVRYNTRPGVNEPWKYRWREKISLEYKWPNLPIKSRIGYEIWIPLNGQGELPFSRHRFLLESDWKIVKKHEITCGLLYNLNSEFGGRYRDIVLKIRYSFTWKVYK